MNEPVSVAIDLDDLRIESERQIKPS